MKITGQCPQGNLVEVVELEDHPWFVACQYHPEFKSKPDSAHPLFREFIRHALEYRELRLGSKSSANGDFETLQNASAVKVG